MKYGITQWSFPAGLYAVRFAAEAGYDGLQVESGSYENAYYMRDKSMQAAYLEDCARYGVELISVVDNDIMHVGIQGDRNGAEYERAIRGLDITLEVAVGLGCNKIMVPLFFQSQIHPRDKGTYQRAVDVMKETCRKAKAHGIVVQVETSIPADMQLELMREIDMPNLVNYYDFQNLYWYDGLDALKELPALMPVNGDEMHICDGWGTMADNGPNGGALLGEGKAHFLDQMKILGEHKWNGWLIAENAYYLESLREKGTPGALAQKDLAALKGAVAQYY